MGLRRMRVEKHRETIAGIEVVDAAIADSMMAAFMEFSRTRDAMYSTRYQSLSARALFGRASNEYTLWVEVREEARLEYIKARTKMQKLFTRLSKPVKM